MTETTPDRDESLIRAHLQGSDTAFGRLVEAHSPGLIGVLEKMVGDPHLAQDLAQEVLIKLHAMLPRYRSRGCFRALLYGMALNRGRDELRRRRRSRLVLLAHPPGRSTDPIGRLETREAIDHSLSGVDEPFRSALYLREVVGLSYRELATAMACTEGTVKSRVSRGRAAFRENYLRIHDNEGEGHEGGQHAS